MPNKTLGIADPGYDALRIYSGQSIAPDLGGGSTGGGGVENKIYVWHADGSTIDLFDSDTAGLTLALAAWAAGDVVWLPACTIAGNFTITQTVYGIDRKRSILSGAITLNAGAVINNLSITGGAAANDECVIYNCDISAATAPALTITGSLGNSPFIYHSTITFSPIGSDYALVCTGYCFVQYCDIQSNSSGATIDHASALFSHCQFHGVGTNTSAIALNLVNGQISDSRIFCVNGHGLVFNGGSATVFNTAMTVITNPTVQKALLITAVGLTLADCSFNSQSGLSLATLQDGDRAKWNHSHTTSVPAAQPPVVIQYDSVGADYKVVTDDSSYNAFVGFTVAADGTYIVVYRKATNHATSKGTIVKKTSSDAGLTWSSESTIVNDATYDARDPALARLANGDLMLTYKLYNQAGSELAGDNSYVKKSVDNGANWSASVTVTSGFTASGVASTPVVELSNGDLLLAIPGSDTGDTYLSSNVAKSTDGGATWAYLATIADGQALSRSIDEPNIVLLDDGTLICVTRSWTVDPLAAIAQVFVSTDSGATWSAGTDKFDLAGNPRLVHLADDSVICITRKAVSYEVVARSSADGGVTWSDEAILDNSTYAVMEYAQGVEIYPGLIAVAYAVEISATNSDVRFLWMAEGGNPDAGDALVGSSLTVYGGDITIVGGGAFRGPLATDLTNTHIYVGNASNVATDVAMSNDATMANTGALTLATVNSNVGSFTNANITVNAKGLVTAAADGSGGGAINVYNETQTADGINTIYYLVNFAAPSTIRVYIDGIRQPASDDVAPVDTVVFDVAPDAGAVLLFDYEMDTT